MKPRLFQKALILAVLIPTLGLGNIVHAEDLKTLASLNLDTTLTIDSDNGYSQPGKIILVPISNGINKRMNFSDWAKGIYYYTVSKLGFQDIPFHYLVSETGEIVRGNSSGDEKKVDIEGQGSAVVIGYLNNSQTDYINSDITTALGNLLIDIANRNAIKPDNISVTGIKFVKEKSSNTVTVQSQELPGSWKDSLSKVIDTIKGKYSPTSRSYSAQVLEVTNPAAEVNPGDEIIASIKLKNNGSSGMYQGSSSEIVLTKDGGGASNFYINNAWLSQTQASIMNPEQALMPGKDQTYEVKLKAPLSYGEYSENFILKTLDGATIKTDKGITIRVKMKKGDKQIIQIKAGSSGVVNVMKNPNQSTILRKVTSGERFYLIDLNQDTLWAEIDLGDGTRGYIAAWQLSYL